MNVIGSPVGWRERVLGGYFQRWVILGALIGIAAGVGAIAFFAAIELATHVFLGGLTGVTPPHPQQSVGDAFTQPGAEALRRLPVFESGSSRHPVGLQSRLNVLAACLRATSEASPPNGEHGVRNAACRAGQKASWGSAVF